jgi:hypothetical protein
MLLARMESDTEKKHYRANEMKRIVFVTHDGSLTLYGDE